ncbi:MAG: hypothetical protein PWQ20_1732 [Thermotogaceae bacterium]|nr:hypothetical protein [Thermotogaceae bacterium]MDN5338662.1 hypothetical protein [Thermotogaceae bacterium]
MRVKLGLDNIIENDFKELKDKRIGLITNASGITSNLEMNIDVFLKNGLNLKKIFSPEHGLFMTHQDGELIENQKLKDTAVEIISLYSSKRAPSKDDIEDVDVLVYDIQDVGLRFYTYIYTLRYCMQKASECEKEFIVLDRPNPLSGNVIRGPMIKENLESFVGGMRLPIRYSLTPGELALYIKSFDKLDLDLKIVKMENWKRDMYYDDTGLFWNIPSPNLPTFESVICYVGNCLIEATNISEGRGTTRPFQFIGAPWIDEDLLYHELKNKNIPGIAFRKRVFMPRFSKFSNQKCNGLEVFPENKEADFLRFVIEFLKVVNSLWPNEFHVKINEEGVSFDNLAGTDSLRKMILSNVDTEEIIDSWKKDEEEFEDLIAELKLYR